MITPKIFRQFSEIAAAMSVRGRSAQPMPHNYSFAVGEDRAKVERRRAKLAERLGFDPDRFAILRQTHSRDVVVVDEEILSDGTEGDALVTDSTGLLLGVTIADCVPVLLYDPESRAVGAVHSGWRGTEKRITIAAIERMASEFGSDPSRLFAWIGPAAGGCCYEVGEEVAERFDEVYSHAIGSRKFLLDTRRVVLDQLIEAGVPSVQIETTIRCTICDPTLHSWRRDAKESGRMVAAIGLLGPTAA